MGKINDIDLKNWKEYEDIISDSLWIIDERDKSVGHKGDYHGNFIPQIPYQLFTRYTKENDWILDPFSGSGTSLIEAKKMNRNAIGIDIDDNMVNEALERVALIDNDNKVINFCDDSASININEILKKNTIDSVQFIIYHPPYWDIIKFNDKKGNIAQSESLLEYLKSFEKIFDNTIKNLENDRYFAIVIGDVYKKGEWIPLSSHILQLIFNKGYLLKSKIVKNVGETKGKANQKALWRYRSLAGGFYVFSHEYVLVFKKSKNKMNDIAI